MNKRDWAYLKLAGTVLLALVAIHGKTSRRWTELHTLGVVLSTAATIGPLILES